ncbi:SRPBCC family protein [Geodermatophilus sp. SYSU D00815]
MSRTRIARSAAVEALVAAPPEAVWAVLADVPRVGEWSSECRGAVWLDGATTAAPGARFRGSNRVRWSRWARTCRVDVVDPPRELVWRTLPSGPYRDSVRWRVALEPADGGTRVVQTYEVLSMPRAEEAVAALLLPEHRDRQAALRADLERLGALAARGARPV